LKSYHQKRVDEAVQTEGYPVNDVSFVVNRLIDHHWINNNTDIPDQIIVNEYLAGQGIKNHVDAITEWTGCVFSLSLLSAYPMSFIPLTPDQIQQQFQVLNRIGMNYKTIEEINETIERYKTAETVDLVLKPRSVIVLKGDARYLWKHGILSKTEDLDLTTNQIVPRSRRVSITFRRRLKSNRNNVVDNE